MGAICTPRLVGALQTDGHNLSHLKVHIFLLTNCHLRNSSKGAEISPNGPKRAFSNLSLKLLPWPGISVVLQMVH